MSCPDCYTGIAHKGNPRGKVAKAYGLDVYVVEPPNNGPVEGIIVIIPDAFGWEFINTRILADHYAERGPYKVYIPEFMGGKSDIGTIRFARVTVH
jgi:dienelactone hydrolase